NFSNTEAPKEITWSVDVSIALTALTTFVVHGFFTLRVYKLSNHNLWFVSVIALLVVLRVVSAFSCVANMARMKTWDSFRDDSAWLFTTGLSISAAADVLIAVSLIFLLRQSRTGWKTMDNLINSIVVYTIENGLLTSQSFLYSIFAILSLVCWVTMSHNLIFLALHFTISKLYANSFLATLNTRKQLLQRSHPSGQRLSVLFPSHRVDLNRNPDNGLESIMQISVEKTIHRVTDNEANPTSPVLPVRFNTPDTRTDDSSSGSKGSQKGRRPQL
ncbi:hypothetical protein BC835DRAFT_1425100, partial [Cytidiella melzeri]